MEYPRVTAEDVSFLKAAIGEGHVSTGESNRDLHAKDESYHEPHRPDVVVWPQKTEDVVCVVKLADERGYAVTPWCSGTSLEGNPIPIQGGIVLDFNEMNRIIEIREQDLQADVEAHTSTNTTITRGDEQQAEEEKVQEEAVRSLPVHEDKSIQG